MNDNAPPPLRIMQSKFHHYDIRVREAEAALNTLKGHRAQYEAAMFALEAHYVSTGEVKLNEQ